MPEFGTDFFPFCSFLYFSFLYFLSQRALNFGTSSALQFVLNSLIYMDAAAAVQRLRDAARELKIFRHPETGSLWLLVQGAQRPRDTQPVPRGSQFGETCDRMDESPANSQVSGTHHRHSSSSLTGVAWSEALPARS